MQTVDVRRLIREDDSLVGGNTEPLEQAASGPQITDVRQEIRSLQADVDRTDRPQDELLLRAGIASYILGQHERAHGYLSRVAKNAVASYFDGLALVSLQRFKEAEANFLAAQEFGFDSVECVLRQADVVRAAGRLDEAEKLLQQVSKQAARRAEYSFVWGCLWADRGDASKAIEYFERAVDMDAHHSRALFRLAAENSLYGNDDEAIRLYERSLAKPPHYMGALLNLGLLYEDRENYPAAAYCFRRVLDADPNNARAALYLKNIEATGSMYYDESSAREEARLSQLLERPITDFELSVRSRNALHGLGLNTLGDLTRVSEDDLLAGKNFGDTSLTEVREMMSSVGLLVGQNLHAGAARDFLFEPDTVTPQEQAALSLSISEMNLSARARKCMTRLRLNTVSELVQRSADELLGSRNFGVTSLNEVRAKLAEMNLKLRND